MSGGKRRVSLWIQSLPQFLQHAAKFEYTEWDQLSAYQVTDLKALGMPDSEAKEMAGIIKQLKAPNVGSDAKNGLASLRDQLLPLSFIKDTWLLVSGMLRMGVSGDIAAPVHALHAVLILLKNLWYLDNAEWLQLRDRVQLGLVKDTKPFGNTSVSMGVAMTLPPFVGNVGILNCGTGGIKYQMYNSEGPLHVVQEFKPQNGASPHNLAVGKFHPKVSVPFERLQELVAEELKQVPWKDMPSTPVYAFVTGIIRAHWEAADEEDKAVLESAMERLFAPHGIKRYGDSFFLSQPLEGKLELIGCAKMYANIVKGGLLDPGTQVVGSFGIGRGSCQWMMLQPDGETHLVGHNAGMANIEKLAGVAQAVMDAYSDKKSEALLCLINALQSADNPVIALKSGCLLVLDMPEFEMLRRTFMAPPVEHAPKTVRLVRNGSNGPPIEITHTGSLDLLCAEASIYLRAPGVNFETVFRTDGSIVESLVDGGELLILASLHEAFIPRKSTGPLTPPLVPGTPLLRNQTSLDALSPPMLVPQRSLSVPESVIHLDATQLLADIEPHTSSSSSSSSTTSSLTSSSSSTTTPLPSSILGTASSSSQDSLATPTLPPRHSQGRGRGSVIVQARSAHRVSQSIDAALGGPANVSREASNEGGVSYAEGEEDLSWSAADDEQVARVRASQMRKGSIDQGRYLAETNNDICCVPKCGQKMFVSSKYCVEHTRLFSHRTEWATSDEVTHDWETWTGQDWVNHLQSTRLLPGDVAKLAEALYEAEDESLAESFGEAGGVPVLGNLIAVPLPRSTTLTEQGFVVYEKKDPGRAEKIAQECLRCLKLLLDYETVVTLILASPDLIDNVALCLHFHNFNFRTDALEFMIVLIWISTQGYDCVHDALKNAQQVFRRSHPYSILFDLIRQGVYGIDLNLEPRHTATADIWDSDPSETKLVLVDLKSLSIVFLNSVLQAKHSLNDRVKVRAQLLDMGLQGLFVPLVRWTRFHSSQSAKRQAQNKQASKQEKMACMLMEKHCADIESNINSFEEEHGADRQLASFEGLDFGSSQALSHYLIDFTSEHISSVHFLSLLQTLCLLPADAVNIWKNIYLMSVDATSHLRGTSVSSELSVSELKTLFNQRSQVASISPFSESVEAATKKLYLEQAKASKLENEVKKLKREVHIQKTLGSYLTHVTTPVAKHTDAYNFVATIRSPPPPPPSPSSSQPPTSSPAPPPPPPKFSTLKSPADTATAATAATTATATTTATAATAATAAAATTSSDTSTTTTTTALTTATTASAALIVNNNNNATTDNTNNKSSEMSSDPLSSSTSSEVKSDLSELETVKQALERLAEAKVELERRLAELETPGGASPPDVPPPPPPPDAPPEAPSAPGAPPGPPGPPSAPGAGPPGAPEPPASADALPIKRRIKPSVPMRRLHWTMVAGEDVPDSLWNSIKEEEVSLNLLELESVFGEQRRPRMMSGDHGLEPDHTAHVEHGETEVKVAPTKRVEQIRLVERRRAQNADISLARFRRSPDAIRDSILAMDLDVLNEERLSQLIAIAPTKEEIELVSSYAGSPSELGLCERFILAVKDIPNLSRRLSAMLFRIQSEQQRSDLREYCECVSSALKQLTNSVRFTEVLRYILAVGNYMNGSTNKGQAYGFKLTSLPRLVTTKSTDGKSNLLQYVIKVLHHAHPSLLDFGEELSQVKEAATMEQAYVELELTRFKEGAKQASIELQSTRATHSEDGVPDLYEAVMKGFCEDTARDITKLTAKYTHIITSLDKALKHFGLPPPIQWEQLFRLVSEFVVTFKREADLVRKHLDAPAVLPSFSSTSLPNNKPRSASQILTSIPIPTHVKEHNYNNSSSFREEEEDDWEAPGASHKKLAHQVMGTLRKGSSSKLTAVMTKRRLHLEGMSSRTMQKAGIQLLPGSPRSPRVA